jgi:CelD/BcsL family acetyltransferase involved in cellulose biosynthesis
MTMLRETEWTPEPTGTRVPTVQIVEDGATFAGLRAEWNALLDGSNAGVFNSWSWLYPWYRRIGSDRQLLILTAREGQGRLVGLWPLCIETRSLLGKTLRRVSYLGENHVGSDYLDVIAPKGREVEIATLLVRALKEVRSRWDLLDLTDFREDSPTLEVLRRELSEWVSVPSDRYLCPYQPLTPGQSFDDFLKGTQRRDNFLRRSKWLQKQEGYALEVAQRPGELALPLEEFFRLHRMRWEADGGSQGIKGAGVEAFHRDATQLLAEDQQLRLFSLKVGPHTLASVYGIVHGGKFIYFQSGYDPAWANKSVGLVLVGETFRLALEEGLQEYDFLRGTEKYKSDWTTATRKTVAITAYARGSLGDRSVQLEAFARHGRNLVKSMLPTQAVETVRRWRRQKMQIH